MLQIFTKGAGLVIKKLQNLGSTPDAVARQCLFGPSGLPVVVTELDKGIQTEPFCVGVVSTDTEHYVSYD